MLETVSFSLIFGYLWQFIKVWYWVFLPFLLWRPFFYFWLYWRTDLWLEKVYKPIILEVKIPKEIEKPIRAMENVMAGIHGAVYHPPDNWEKIIDGQVQTGVEFSIVSIGGETHFYIRFWEVYRKAVEAAIYSQYPEAEIIEAEDYTKKVPEIPNKDWDLFAIDYRLAKANPYPIKTYPKFETEQEKEPERVVDPIATLLESFAQLKPEEQFWIQIRATPLGSAGELGLPKGTAASFLEEAEALKNKLAKRPGKPKRTPMIEEALKILITGKPSEKPAPTPEEESPPVRMRLTPGEEETMKEVEKKATKPVFRVGIRFIYLGKREVFFNPNFRLAFNFFNCFMSVDANGLIPWGGTITKIKKSIFFPPLNWIRPRRDYLRCRKIFRQYKERLNTLFPRIGADKGIFILNTEELASLWHFPSWRVAPAPGVARIEEKKVGPPPPELPIE